MTTPRKNFDLLESPYANHLPQYPSQSESYIPFDLGGPGQCSQNKDSDDQHRRYTSTPAKYNRGINSNRFNDGSNVGRDAHFYQNRQNHRGRGNNRYFGGRSSFFVDSSGVNETGQPRQQQQRYSGTGYRKGGNSGVGEASGPQRFKNYHNKDDMTSYFHSSMLEDPWKDLMKRYNAIKNSRIDFQQQNRDNADANDSSTEGGSDAESELKIDDN